MRWNQIVILLLLLISLGCAEVERSLDSDPKLVILDEKDSHIACQGGVSITEESQGKYAVRFKEINGSSSIGVTDVHGVMKVETRDLSATIRESYGLNQTADVKRNSVLQTCLGTASVDTPHDTSAVASGNPYKPSSPCLTWYNAHPKDKNPCNDEQNPTLKW